MTPNPPHDEAELVELIRSVDVRAPQALHRRTEALLAERSGHRGGARRAAGRRRGARSGASPAVIGALVLVVAVAVVVAASLSGAGSSRLSVGATAALTLKPATMTAPSESRSVGTQLTAAVDGIAFPYWEERFGWRSSGARTDHLDGRTVRTVFYTDERSRRIGYAIVSGTPAPQLRGGVVRWQDGVPYRLLSEQDSRVVAWLREGHLCVVGGRGVDDATLLRLASWAESATTA